MAAKCNSYNGNSRERRHAWDNMFPLCAFAFYTPQVQVHCEGEAQ